MKPQELALVQVLRICNVLHIRYVTNKDNYVLASSVCIWCEYKYYVGMQHKNVPEDLQAYFLTPQDYKRYVHELEGLI